MWSRGTIRMWVGARGAMSWKAITTSSSWTRRDGSSPATMRQKRQRVVVMAGSRYQSSGLVLIRKAIIPTANAIT